MEPVSAADKSSKVPASAWKTLAILSSLATMVMYAETMLIPAIPDLIVHFGVSYSISSWILAAYLIPGAVMTPIAGKLSDIYGRKKVLIAIMAIYATGVAMAGFSTNIYFLFLSRGIQGIGMAMFAIAFSIVREQFPRNKISIGQGVITSMFASGAVLGLVLGGIIVKSYGWQATFFSTTPIAVALLFIIWRTINIPGTQNKVGKEKNIDIKGAATLAVFITSLLLAITLLETESGKGNPLLVGSFFAASATSLTLFIIIERRATSPLIDLKLLANRAILPSNLIIMIVGFSMFMVFQTIPVLVRNPSPLGFGGDAAAAGYVQLPFALVLLVVGPTAGFIVARLGSLKPVVIGTAVTTAGFIGLFLYHSNPFSVALNLAVLSTGLSLTNVGAMNVTILATPIQFIGISLGMSSMMRILGSSVGPAIAGMFMEAYKLPLSGAFYPSMQSYEFIFLTASLLSAVSVAIAVVLRIRVKKMAIANIS